MVWSQVTVGDTVYATGGFTRARPPGSPAGSNEVVRNNLLAYNITTGNLITSFNHSLNARGPGRDRLARTAPGSTSAATSPPSTA